jgi:hypothetical protein
MGKPYSMDLREGVVAAVETGGLSCHQAAAQFGVVPSIGRASPIEADVDCLQLALILPRASPHRVRGSLASINHAGTTEDEG